MTLKQAAAQAGVAPGTLSRWARTGVIPGFDGDGPDWPAPAVAHARIVARLRARGHSLESIRRASEDGRLAFGYVEDLFDERDGEFTVDEAAETTGLEPALIERIWASLGLPHDDLDRMTAEDLDALTRIAAALDSGYPLVAVLQLTRVYGQTLSRIADAETRLFHTYVHEPLMRRGVPSLEMAEQMEGLAGELVPLTSPLMDYVHRRFLRHYVEQDVVGHMEMDLDGDAQLGRMRVVICFADLAGYTRFTEREGEEQALSYVERFIDAVAETLPDDARIVKTIGDEVMVVGQDVAAMVDWAVGFQRLWDERPAPRIGVHAGHAIYRDGDYFGLDVNLAARVVARARGKEVIVTDAVQDRVRGRDHLAFENIGQVKLKGFDEPRVLCRAFQAPE